MNSLGHNERSFRLDALASEAREGLSKVEQGQEFTIGGWLAYGHALNEGRALFPSDEQFGQWVASSGLSQLGTHEIKRDDRAAAMWAAANADQFEEARAAGNARTIRGIHAKWKEIEAEKKRAAEEQARMEAQIADAAGQPEPEQDVRHESTTQIPQENNAESDDDITEGTTPDIEQQNKQQQGSDHAPVLDESPDPYGYAKLTEDALLDLANGLRAELDEEKAKRKAAEAERDQFKAANRELSSTDSGRFIAKLQNENRSMRYARDEALKAAKREEYKRKQAEKELSQVRGEEIRIV